MHFPLSVFDPLSAGVINHRASRVAATVRGLFFIKSVQPASESTPLSHKLHPKPADQAVVQQLQLCNGVSPAVFPPSVPLSPHRVSVVSVAPSLPPDRSKPPTSCNCTDAPESFQLYSKHKAVLLASPRNQRFTPTVAHREPSIRGFLLNCSCC